MITNTKKYKYHKVVSHENYKVVYLETNRLDATCAQNFIFDVKKSIGKGQRALILDLSPVQFMDSSGLGAIISIFKSLHSTTLFLLCGAGENVKKLLDITRISSLFKIYPDTKAAEQALAC